MISRRTPILRSAIKVPRSPAALKRRTRVKNLNRRRREKNLARSYGEKRAWIVAQPCAVCHYPAPSEPAHTSGDGGTGRKASSTYLLPLCPPHDEPSTCYPPGVATVSLEGCHRESHRIGVTSFEAKHGVSLVVLAAEHEATWQAFLLQSVVSS